MKTFFCNTIFFHLFALLLCWPFPERESVDENNSGIDRTPNFEAVSSPTRTEELKIEVVSSENNIIVAKVNIQNIFNVSEVNDDMDVAEINLFRPLFRYRAAYAKKAG